MEDRKKHAYFQDNYRRSSNFGKNDSETTPDSNQDGTIHLEKEDDSSVKEIRKTVDSLLEDSEDE